MILEDLQETRRLTHNRLAFVGEILHKEEEIIKFINEYMREDWVPHHWVSTKRLQMIPFVDMREELIETMKETLKRISELEPKGDM